MLEDSNKGKTVGGGNDLLGGFNCVSIIELGVERGEEQEPILGSIGVSSINFDNFNTEKILSTK